MDEPLVPELQLVARAMLLHARHGNAASLRAHVKLSNAKAAGNRDDQDLWRSMLDTLNLVQLTAGRHGSAPTSTRPGSR